MAWCGSSGPPPHPKLSIRDTDALWVRAVGVRPNLLRSESRPYGSEEVPVRGLVASTRIARGERIATVPASLVLTGQVADRQLRRVARAAASTTTSSLSSQWLLRPYEDAVARLQSIPAASPRLLGSRDALLLTALLYVFRSTRCAGLVSCQSPLFAWVRTLPPRVPPFGLLLARRLEAANKYTPLARQLRLGELTKPLLPGTNAATATTELMVAAVEANGLTAGLRTPRTEVVLTDAMLADFHSGRHTALTARQFEAAAAHTRRHGGSASVRRLAAMEEELHQAVLLPLLGALTRLPIGADTVEAAEELAVLRWAHFSVRSRAVNLGYRQGPAQLAVVPLLDRLNHSHAGANVAYHYRPEGGEDGSPLVVVTASRAIAAGEELTLHYGSLGQRGFLFGDEAPAVATTTRSPTGATCEPTSASKARRQRAEAVAASVLAIEARQRCEMTVDEDTDKDTVFAVPPQDPPSRSGYSARGHKDDKAEAECDATAEATWLWRYGFLRSEEERAYVASRRWSRGLRDRLAHLTDVRRRGSPGAFVVGVPEGLELLREQRESLERERYHNTRVFPPQQA